MRAGSGWESGCALGEVPSLAHEPRNDPVERAPLIVERLAALPHALLARAEGAEVVHGLGGNLCVRVCPCERAIGGQAKSTDATRCATVESGEFRCLVTLRCARLAEESELEPAGGLVVDRDVEPRLSFVHPHA